MAEERLVPGIYEKVIDTELSGKIRETDGKEQAFEKEPLDEAAAPKVLAGFIGKMVEQKLSEIADTGGKDAGRQQAALVNRLIRALGEEEEREHSLPDETKVNQLLAVTDLENTGAGIVKHTPPVRPDTSVAQSSLFTGAAHEPQMYTELQKEIASADEIDMLVSFIRWSGLRLIWDALRRFAESGKPLRIITTTYMGATDVKAVEELSGLPGARIRISYDVNRTRLHAKTYTFIRRSGYSTAYVGSSNMSNPAMTSGLEWNVKVTEEDQHEIMEKIRGTFDAYWNSAEFEEYTQKDRERLKRALKEQHGDAPEHKINPYLMDVVPYSYQQEILDELDAERCIRNRYRNLVVAATGTGKTVIAALDYKRFTTRKNRHYAKLLFVAHREEILEQSLECFREVLKDPEFGDILVGSHRNPAGIEQLFISVQTFRSRKLWEHTSADFYDFIVVDEFHHAAADSYQKLLTYYKPEIFLGLTATPERMDGKDILAYFDHRIAAQIRLPEAIDRKMLCPFQYFGVDDNADLSQIRWTRGGYDDKELSDLYVFSREVALRRADNILREMTKYVTDMAAVKGLGFCVSKEHTRFMADYFAAHGVPAVSLTSDSPDDVRENAKRDLIAGKIKVIFVVDLYNEGVDIRQVNTVLFLRPTQSLTIFLQQLGRGLRLSEGKECLTVLDFIGQANRKYDFEQKFAALLSDPGKSVEGQIRNGFVAVPRGCYIRLEKKAAEVILENIRAQTGTTKGILARIASFEEDSGKELSLANFLSWYSMPALALYRNGRSFAVLCAEAGVRPRFEIPEDGKQLIKALPRIAMIDSRRWIRFLLDTFDMLEILSWEDLNPAEKRMARMFQFTVWQDTAEKRGFADPLEGFRRIHSCPELYQEVRELLQYDLDQIDFVDEPVDLGFDCPLDLHCRYTRDQIFVAMDELKPSNIRQGVYWLKDKKIDVFINTLNKEEKDYSPSTMYEDYSISEYLFHWQSQSTTSEDSPTGQRYIHHREMGDTVLLFVREYKRDAYGNAAPFVFLGKAEYVSHTGSRPMSVIWRLEKPIPANLIRKTGKLIAQ